MPIVIIPMVLTTVLVTLDILAMDTHAVRFTAVTLLLTLARMRSESYCS